MQNIVVNVRGKFHDDIKFFALRVVEPWNNLPSSIVDFVSLHKFKRSLLKIT